jgi:hypothetical protein
MGGADAELEGGNNLGSVNGQRAGWHGNFGADSARHVALAGFDLRRSGDEGAVATAKRPGQELHGTTGA